MFCKTQRKKSWENIYKNRANYASIYLKGLYTAVRVFSKDSIIAGCKFLFAMEQKCYLVIQISKDVCSAEMEQKYKIQSKHLHENIFYHKTMNNLI